MLFRSLPRSQSTPGFKPGVVVFGLWVFWILAGVAHADPCAPTSALQRVRVDRVIDGDTFALADGRHVRLIGINAPETGRGDKSGEPLGQVARAALSQALPRGATAYLQIGVEPRDHYGRILAQVFQRGDGGSVEAMLVQQGLAQRIAIPPNLALADCLRAAEHAAYTARRGVWGEPYFAPRDARQLREQDAGYRRVRLTITDAHADRNGWWLETNGPLTLRLSHRDAALFPDKPTHWIDRTWVVRGWIKNRGGDPRIKQRGYAPLLLSLQHPDMVESGL